MSATNRGAKRIERDSYQTPEYCIDLLLPLIDWPMVRTFLAPCRGAGAIYDCVRVPTKAWCEIREGRDYLTTEYPERFDLIITNPPFSLAMEFLQKSLNEAKRYWVSLNHTWGPRHQPRSTVPGAPRSSGRSRRRAEICSGGYGAGLRLYGTCSRGALTSVRLSRAHVRC